MKLQGTGRAEHDSDLYLQHKGINVIPMGGKPLRAGWGEIGIAPHRRPQLVLQHAQQLVHRLDPSLRM